MLPFLLKRLLAAIPVMAVVAIVVFAILRLTPGTMPLPFLIGLM